MAQITGKRLLVGSIGLVLVCGLVACDPGGEPTPSDTGTTEEPSSEEPTSVEPTTDEPTESTTDDPSTAPSSTADPRVTAAAQDLADRLGLQLDQIIVGPVEEVTWSDGSIGCPQPGQQYTQALVEGQRVILTVTGTEYSYHARGDDAFFYCEQPVDPAPSEDATA